MTSFSRRYELIVLLLGASLLAAGCELASLPDSAKKHVQAGYPTTLPALSEERLAGLREAYEKERADPLCTPLNRFGFTEWKITGCLNDDHYRPDSLDQYPALLVERARQALKAYSRFTGVRDTTQLEVNRVELSRVLFHHQHYAGLEVKRTQLIVDQNSGGVFAIGGNWYPNIHVPATDQFSRREAQRSLIGVKLMWNDFGGEPHPFEVTGEAFPEKAAATKLILPVEYEDRIELHVVWQTEVYGLFGNGGAPAWYIYVDTTTGEQLKVEQLFET